jgi:hypothetical protein
VLAVLTSYILLTVASKEPTLQNYDFQSTVIQINQLPQEGPDRRYLPLFTSILTTKKTLDENKACLGLYQERLIFVMSVTGTWKLKSDIFWTQNKLDNWSKRNKENEELCVKVL